MFRGNPTFQLSIALLVMFLAYVAQVECRPYMSNSEMREVVEEAIANGDMVSHTGRCHWLRALWF